MKISLTFVILSMLGFSAFGQEIKEVREKFPTHFAFQLRGLVPNKFSEQRTNTVFNDTLTSSIKSKYGFSFGGVIRRRYTDRLGIEMGLNICKRYYDVSTGIPDSNQFFTKDFAFTNFELPVNGLVFIKLSERFYTNAGLGISAIYKPSSVAAEEFKENKGEFSMAGIVEKKFNLNINAQLGFEFVSDRSGIFYLGGSAHIPTGTLFYFYSKYNYANSDIFSAVVYNQRSPFFTLDLRFYFPTIKNKGDQPLRGPIE
jgi:hypothetical protein